MYTKIEEAIVAELLRQADDDACTFIRDDRHMGCGVMIDGAIDTGAIAAAVGAAMLKRNPSRSRPCRPCLRPCSGLRSGLASGEPNV